MAASPGGVEVSRLSVRVVPDTSHLGQDLKVALDRIEAQTDLTISTSIDTTDLDAQARAAVEQAQLAAGDLDIKANVDTSQVAEAERVFGSAGGAAQSFSLGLSGVATAAIVLGPALIPLIAIVGGLGAALVAPLAIAGGGLTVFGFLSAFAISETNKQLKQIGQLQTKLGTLTKGSEAYIETATQLRNAQAALTPAQAAFGKSLDGLKAAFDSIPKAIILGPITAGLNVLANILPLLTPLAKAVSVVLADLLGQLDKAASSQGFKDFVAAFANQLGPDLRAFAAIAGNVFAGLFGLFGAFNKQLSGSVLQGLVNLTAAFADWGRTLGQSQGFKSFVDYLKRIAPVVGHALAGIAAGFTAIVVAFAPVGTIVIKGLGDLGRAISNIPIGPLTAIATAFVAVVAAAKLAGPVVEVITFAIASPEILLAVGVIAAIAGAFFLLYQRSKPLQNVLADLKDFFLTQLLPVIKVAAEQILPALDAAFHDISKTIKDNKGFLEVFGELLLTFASAAVVTAILGLVGAIRAIGKYIAAAITVVHAFVDVWLLGIAGIIRAFGGMVDVIFSAFGTITSAAALAFGWMPKIGDKVKDANAAFQSFRDSVTSNFDAAADNVDSFRRKVDAVGGVKTVHVHVDDLAAIRQLEALQAFRLQDKTITFNMRERAVGPGGGIGQPAPDSTGPRSGGSGSGALVNVEHMHTSDATDIIRKSQSALRGRAGGGVVLAGSN